MEVWAEIKDISPYEVSNTGKVRNSKTGRIMKTHINKKGYESISLRKNKTYVTKRVHRLVADAFYDGNNDGLDVNHEDGDKKNNNISNLTFCTRKENIDHAFRTGLKKPSRQIRVRVIETGEEYESIRECARQIGEDQSEICQCLNGKMRSCHGLHFEKVK